jgi:hypothetical protein
MDIQGGVMIVYARSKAEFVADVRSNRIEDHILSAFVRALRRHPSPNEVSSWKHSLQFVRNAVDHPELPDDAGIAVEFAIPMTSKRVDVILCGRSDDGRPTAVIIELKQWSDLEATDREAIVRTVIGRGKRDVVHPSYQAWTYATLIEDFNETVRDERVQLVPCAFLHNLKDGSAVNDRRYAEHLGRAPVFLHADTERFSAYLRQFVRSGDDERLLFRIENGRLRPSRALAEVLLDLLAGEPAFQLIDEQKLVYETVLALAAEQPAQKRVVVVRGGPGTGKSVVAINLLVELIDRGKVTRYVSRNAAPREVYSEILSGRHPKGRIRNLFGGTGSFMDAPPDLFDVLIVDEAHRVTEKSGFYGNEGTNQISELIYAAHLSVFFLDEDQRVTLNDIGTAEEIRGWAAEHGARVEELELPSQFRCNGSDGYIAFLDDALGIRDTANKTIAPNAYDFRVFDDADTLHNAIRRFDREGNRARLVAGYCWPWKSKKDPSAMDIVLADGEFQAQWNLTEDGSLWIMDWNWTTSA